MRMFRHCTGEKNGQKECIGCTLFRKCLIKKLRRKIKKYFLRILWVIFLIILLIIVAEWNRNEAKKEERNRLIRQRNDVAVTKEISNKEIKVTRLSNQSEVFLKPTSSTIPTRKLGDKHQYENVVVSTKVSKAKVTKKPEKAKAKKVVKVKSLSRKKKHTIQSKILKDYASLSAYDRKLMEKTVYAEARGESLEGQIAVAAVILNRYIFYKKQKSIKELITGKNQFANISDVTEDMLSKYPDCKKAVKEAIAGNDPTKNKFPEGARYFYEPDSPYISEYQLKIREGVEGLRIGCHIFHNDFSE